MRRRAAVVALAGAIALPLCVAVPVRATTPRQTAPPAPDLVLVMPFEPIGDHPALAWLPEASAILLADGLTTRGVVTLDRTTRARVLSELDLPVAATLSRASIIHIGQVIGATRVVTGSLSLEAGELIVAVRPVRLTPLDAEPSFAIRAPLADLFVTFARITERLAPMEAAGRPPTPAPMLPVDAFERFVKGMLASAPELRVESLREAVARAPEDVRARLALWEATTDAGDSEAALEIARSVPPESPAFRPARLLAARSLVALGRLDEAFEGLRALGEEKADAQLFEHMGLVQLRRGSPTETGRATYYYQRAVDLTPEDPDALFNLGYAYWVEQDAAGASYWLRRAVARRPTDGVARYILGLALDALGRLEEGARERALARRVSDVVAGWDAEGGRDILDSGALVRIRQPSPAPQIAQIEARLGDAARLVGERLAHHHLERGRRLFEARRDALAIDELDRAIRLAPQLPDAFVLAGRLHLRAGQPEQALALLRLAPASSEVDELLDQIRTAAAR